MNRRQLRNFLFIDATVLLIAVGWLAFYGLQNADTTSPVREARVDITDDGFEPNTITVKAGTRITWDNQDPSPYHITSGPYPTHALPDLDSIQNIGPGVTYSFIPTQTGTFAYYNALDPTTQGQIIVVP